jgi:N-acetylglucosamine kinase-like BadF-type ATPase
MFRLLYKVLALFFSILFLKNLLAVNSQIAQTVKNNSGDIEYIICIDGGGSKTELQALDKNGNLVELKQNNTSTYSVKSGGSNINAVGKVCVEKELTELLTGVKIYKTDIDLVSIANKCLLIGGFAGTGSVENRNIIRDFFKKYNFDDNKILVTSDAEMALELAGNNEIVLIAGTGSICFGKKDLETKRVGGLGRLIGDEGAGYYIGIHALKAALEDEYGWGRETCLKLELRKYFSVNNLREIIGPFYRGEISPFRIAAITPIVFLQAQGGDTVSIELIDDTAKELGKILACMIQKFNFAPCKIYLIGGIFKNKNSGEFIKKIIYSAGISGNNNWELVNKAEGNPTVMTVQKLLA